MKLSVEQLESSIGKNVNVSFKNGRYSIGIIKSATNDLIVLNANNSKSNVGEVWVNPDAVADILFYKGD